jgi:general stress protein 26
MDTPDGIAAVREIIQDVEICMLTTVDDDGHLVGRPMAVQKTEFDGDLWFVSDGGGRKVDQIRHGDAVGVTFSSRSAWLSVAGRAELVQDTAKAEQLWNKGLDAWFPQGPTTPGLTLVKVRAESAEYWDSPGGAVSTLISYAKAKTTGRAYSGGEHEVVDLTSGQAAPTTTS